MAPSHALLPLCQQLLHRFFHCLDQSDYDGLLALFDPDGVWHRQGVALRGHMAMAEAMQTRSTTQRIRHVLSNVFVHKHDDHVAEVGGYMAVYRFDNGHPQDGLVTIDGPSQLYAVQATIRLGADDATLVALTITPEFRFVAAA
ncbi:nuclear transport factor 2 family protein [Cupriavidus sp. 2TAF22]|uniref:nuclear transport factor 2 family protein n=1 Tax=unclassified Cupriavidus TaxID=2640874 RepID=UPI003F9394F5